MSIEKSVQKRIDEKLSRDSDWAQVTLSYLLRMKQGFYDQKWVDVIVQRGWGGL